MIELLQLLQLAKDSDLATKVANLATIAQAHDAEIRQLREQINQLIDSHNGAMGTSAIVAIAVGVGFTAAVAGMVYQTILMGRVDRRLKALEGKSE
ncbi:hypothetical protein [Anaerobaca lacustris]|uniref:Uncharacterized protein n=1 Tax=Anaerobaca lacustris TaxID=3044600 RepID=A0AAW6TUD9_9BACT|nr:hypothetical protein [Sedimentisphaerales bacterium M17dextr]